MLNKINQIFQSTNKKGFFHLLSANLLIQIVGFASQLIVAGILSPDDIGRIKIIQTFSALFSIVGGMGFNASTLKLCSENRSEKEKIQLLYSGVIFTIGATFLVYLFVILMNFWGVLSSDKIIKLLIPLGLFPLITNSLFAVFTAYFQADKQIKHLSGLTISNKLITIAGIVLLTIFFGIKGYYIAFNASLFIILIPCFTFLFTQSKAHFLNFTESKKHFNTHWFYARKSVLTQIVSEVSAYLDILIINFMITDITEIGFYSFALTLTVALRVFPGTVQQISIPYFSSTQVDKTDFLKTYKYYNKQLYLVVFGTLLIALSFASPIISFIFAGKYNPSIPYFVILAIGWSIRQLTQLQSAAIFGLGKIQYNAYANLVIMIFNLIALPITIYFYGLKGAAFVCIPSNLLYVLISRFFLMKAINKKFQENYEK